MPEFTPRDDELTDPRVRQLLWRLRARLVVPPDADRVEQDLVRLLASAQEHAHDAPGSAGSADASSGLEPVATSSSHDDRAASSGVALSRVAVVVVLLAALGGGIATAGDGPLSLQVLLGARNPGQQAQPVELAVPEPPSESAQDAGVTEPLTDLDPVEPDTRGPADRDVEVEPQPQPAEPAPEPGVAESVPPPASTPAPSPGAGDGAAGTGSGDPAPARTPAAEPAPELVEPQEAVEPPQEALAAPPPRDLDGFGGPQPCPEGQDLASCLDDRASVEEAEDDSAGNDDGAGGDEATGDEATGDVAADDGLAPDDDTSSDDGAPPGEDATGDGGSGSEQDELARRRGAG